LLRFAFVYPDLTPEERSHASKRMIMDRGFDPSDPALRLASSRKTSWTDVKKVLTDWPKLVVIMFNLITTLPVSAFGIFLPLITQGEIASRWFEQGPALNLGVYRNGIFRYSSELGTFS
jgi:hypothetical protein